MTLKYLRTCILTVSDNSGSSLDLSMLRITFRVTHGTVQTPRLLSARIWNPAPSTISQVKKAFTSITLSVGYGGTADVLFDGQIQQTRDGQESPSDTFLDIFATTGDRAYVQATTSATLPIGWQYSDVHNQLVSDMAADNIAKGAFPERSGSAARPKVLYGMTRDHCRVLGTAMGAAYNIDDNLLSYYDVSDMVKMASSGEPAVLLSPDTGLIGVPVQTPDGVQATCLMDTKLKRNALVKISGATLLDAQADLSIQGVNGGNQITTTTAGVTRRSVLGTSPTGTYRVVFVDHMGDTRGNEWFSVVTCVAVDVSTVQSYAARTAAQD